MSARAHAGQQARSRSGPSAKKKKRLPTKCRRARRAGQHSWPGRGGPKLEKRGGGREAEARARRARVRLVAGLCIISQRRRWVVVVWWVCRPARPRLLVLITPVIGEEVGVVAACAVVVVVVVVVVVL